MKAIRLHLTQKSAHYRKEESVDNKMTYPLPFPSTIIGALHAACGYREYHPMDISIQGNFGSMQRETYVDHCFLNTVMDDRGMLVKMKNGDLLSAGFTKVAKAKKSQGNSFKNNVTIEVFNESLLQEYQELKRLREALDLESKEIKSACKSIDEEMKEKQDAQKNCTDQKQEEAYKNEIKALKEQRKALLDAFKSKEQDEYIVPIDCFKNITTSIKYYEMLYDVDLVIHVRAEDEILDDILQNIDNLQSLGRSEDFVSVEECVLIDLTQEWEEDEVSSKNSMYIAQEDYYSDAFTEEIHVDGTKYYANKNYVIDGKKGIRKFVKIPVVFGKAVAMATEELEGHPRLWIDAHSELDPLIVDFL